MTGHEFAIPCPSRPLGRTGIDVPVLGLGTVKLGRNTGVKYPKPFDLPSDEQAIELLATARELGITLLDTAPAYGHSEARIGELLARTAALGGRDAWLLATKAGETFDPATAESRHDFSPAAITESVHRSLGLLRTDHLDIVLLHSDGRDAWIVEHSGALEALAALKAQGKLRVFGISTKSPEGAMLALERTAAPVDVLMLTINPAYDADRPVAAEAARNGVGVLVKKALISGHVAGQTGGHAGREAPTPEACIRHALGSEGVSSVIVGTLSPANLRANVVAACRAVAGGCPHDGLVF